MAVGYGLKPRRNHFGLLKAIFLLNIFCLSFIEIPDTPAPNVVMELRFNEGSGTSATDGSGNSHSGTLVNGPVWATGKYGQGLNFDGTNDYVSVADHANFTLDPTVSYTWSAWVRSNNFNQWSTIWSQTLDANNFFYFYAHSSNDADAGPVTNGVSVFWWTNGGTNKLVAHTTNNVLATNTWAYVTVTYNASVAQNSRFTIYVNGVDVTNRNDISSTGTLATLNPNNTRFGANQPYGEYFNGGLDELRYYRRLLSVAEIQADMNIGNAPDTQGPAVSITSPAAGSVSGTINVNATATDNVGVAGVQFQLDGVNLGAEDLSSPYSVSWNTTTTTNGSHTLTAIARDAAGNTTTSSSIVVNVNNAVDATPPVINITSPTGGTTLAGSINVNATATDNVGVVGVQFQLDGVNLGAEDLSSPYSVAWNTTTTSNGNHTLTAIARDATGNTSTSSSVIVNVNNIVDAAPPVVSITSPSSGATIAGSVSITANATDDIGVVGVQFLLNGVNLGSEDLSAPYSVAWNTAANTNGNYTLTARARDAVGNTTTSSPINVTVFNNNLVASYGFNENSGVTANDNSGNNNNGTLTNGPAWSSSGRFGAAILFDGTNDMVAIPDASSLDLTTGMTLEAWVNPSNLTGYKTIICKDRTSSAFSYVLSANNNTSGAANQRPNSRLRVGSSNRTVTGTSKLPLNTWTHVASTYDGAVYRLFINGNQVATLNSTGNITTSTDLLRIGGSAALGSQYFAGLIDEVRIYNRALSQSEIQTDMITPIAPDLTNPTVSLTAPVAGPVSGTVNITANASDNIGVAGVQFLLNGSNLGAEDLTAPYTIPWNTTSVANGTYTLSARARDGSGNISTSTDVIVEVNNDTELPIIEITSPSAGTINGTVNVNANASDNVGVVGVQFLLDGNNLSAEDLVAPYTISWNTTTIADGNHTLTARVRDAAGNVQTSAAIAVNVLNNPPDTEFPAVAITFPAAGEVSGQINITASATDNVAIVGVQFLVNGVNQGVEDIVFPYLVAWNTNSIPNGNYNITAKARDAAGNITTSNAVVVNVNNVPDSESPVITITSPAGGNVSATINVAANATDNVGVVGVQFLLNGVNLGAEDLTAPYAISWNTVTSPNGNYTLTAKARDLAGNITTSAGVNVTVSNVSGLIAAYPFNEPSGTAATDMSGNNHNGVLTNSPTRIAGRYDQGISLDGSNDYINIPDHNNFTLNPSQNYTWSGWVRNNNFNQWSTVWSQTIDADNFFYFYAHSSNDGDAGPVTNGVSVYWWTNFGNNRLVIHSNNNVLTAGQWAHITVTYNASATLANRFTIYVNGVDVTNRSDVSSAGTLATINPTNIRIGSTQPFGEYLNGAVDEFRFYQRLLTPAEVVNDMNTSLGVDLVFPTASLTSPSAGAVVYGKVNLTANASDNVGVLGAQFLVDGLEIGTEDLTAPYAIEWNTEGTSVGAHNLSVRVRDAAGNIATSSEVPITIQPNFTFTILSPERNVESTGQTDFRIYVSYNNGFVAPGGVALSVSGLPASTTHHFLFNPMSHQGETQLYVNTIGTPFGSYPLVLSATAEGITHTVQGILHVTPASDFSLMASPSIQNVSVGAATTFSINVNETNDYTSAVNLSVVGLPAGVTATFSPSSPIPAATSTLTLTTTAATPIGTYELTVRGESNSLVRTIPITLTVSSSASLWTVVSIGATGVPNNTVRVGALRTDGQERVYVGTIATGRMLEYTWNNGTWAGPVDVGGSPSGIEIHDCNIGPGRGDGKDRLYAASYDFNIYEIWHDATGWHQLTMGNVGNNLGMHMDIGDGRNDGVTRVYAASTQQLFEFTWNGTSWNRVLIGSTPGAHGVAIGKGRGDGKNYIYIASISSGNFEAVWNGSSWTISSMGDAGDARGVGLGDARNDGVTRVYSAIYDGRMREFTWNGSNWTFVNMPSTGTQNIHAYIIPGRNDGVNRLYTDNGNGKVWEYSWTGSGWTTYNMGGGSDYMYGLHFGRGRNDGILRLYSADRGSVNRVYEFTWTTPPPISFLRKYKPQYSIWDLK